MSRHAFSSGAVFLASLLVVNSNAAPTFDSATLTRVENKVTIGEIKGGQASGRRPAAVSESVKANNFIQTGSESRAELQFKDKSLVRVGQNSIFSFESKSRTLSLQEGSMLFYVAPGNGGGTIKTPAMTAAITGTLCKVSTDTIATLRGSVTIQVSGKPLKIPAGFAVKVSNGQAQVFRFDGREAGKGKLYAMGPLPEDPGLQVARKEDSINWTTIDPRQFNPAFNRVAVPPVVQVAAIAATVPVVQEVRASQPAPPVRSTPITPPRPQSTTTNILWRGRSLTVPNSLLNSYLSLGATVR
jgi:hypothetical protein